MDPTTRVLTACAFQRPDRIPRLEFFWEYPPAWEAQFGPLEAVNDLVVLSPNEGAFITRARPLRRDGPDLYEIDRWGRTVRRREGAYFVETLSTALEDPADIERLPFDPPDLERRFAEVELDTILDAPLLPGSPSADETAAEIQRIRQKSCVFGKTGGPFLRSTYLRGETQFLLDIGGDPGLARALAERVATHLIAVGCEEIRRWSLQATGILISDDIAYNNGPLVGPQAFEQILLPSYRRMVQAFKSAGARYVFFHSDGDIRRLLPMLVDAGIDGINPVEPRAHMRMAELRRLYPRLVLTGGMDNTGTLVYGPPEKIAAETCEIIDLARDGGVIIGSGSTGPEISSNNFAIYHQACRTQGVFSEGGDDC